MFFGNFYRELERKIEKLKHMKLEVVQPGENQKQYELPAWVNQNWLIHVNRYR